MADIFKNYLEHEIENKIGMEATAFTVETTPNTISDEGDMTVLVFPSDTAVLAIKLEGDAVPRWILAADPGTWGLMMGDGTTDTTEESGGLVYSNHELRIIAGSGGVIIGQVAITPVGDLTFGTYVVGPVLMSPDFSLHRIKVANDGSLSTEPVV